MCVVIAIMYLYYFRVSAGQVSVKLGAHDRLTSGRVVGVDNIVIRSDWNPSTFQNDVALLRLITEIQFTDEVRT